jgi:cobalt-zinc-cadmium efflux system protein
MHMAPKSALRLALATTFAFFAAELAGGLWTRSLGLVSDSLHMLLDSTALGLSLLALTWAERPANPVQTYGFKRAEVLAAFFNAMLLMGLSAVLIVRALGRLAEPVAVRATPMLWIAAAGFAVNLFNLWLLHRGQAASLNIRSAYLHVLSDCLGSLAVVTAALLIRATGLTLFDSLASLLISGLILASAVRLFIKTLGVLMEASPSHLSTAEVKDSLSALPGVTGVHDLHVWTLTSGFDLLTAHLTVDDPSRGPDLLTRARAVLRERFGIDHATLQIEPESHREACRANGACP